MIGSSEIPTIPLKLESAGTLKMFALYPLLQEVLETGVVLFVDEGDMKIRKDENYEKNYLLGKYGAIPTMKHFDMIKGE